MKWFDDLSISKKLTCSFLIMTFFTVLLGAYTLLKVSSLAKQDQFMYDKCVNYIQQLGIITGKYERLNGVMRDQLIAKDASSLAEGSQNILKMQDEITAAIQKLVPEINDNKEKSLYDNLCAEYSSFRELTTKYDSFINSGQKGEAEILLGGSLNNAAKSTRASMEALFQFNTDNAQKIISSNNSSASGAFLFTIIILFIAVAASIVAAKIIAGKFNELTGKILFAVNELTKGRIKTRIIIDSGDEFGDMARALNKFASHLEENVISPFRKISEGNVGFTAHVADIGDEISPVINKVTVNIRNLVAETSLLTKSAIEGNLKARGDAGKFTGAYKELIEEINNTLDSMTGPLVTSAEYMDKISKGVIPDQITDNYKGDFNKIKLNLNSLICVLNGFSNAAKEMAYQHSIGEIDSTIDAEKYPGIYGLIAKSMDGIIKNNIDVNAKVMDVVGHYAVGDFSVDIDRFPGKMIKLTESVDLVKKNLMDINQEIVNVANAAVQGDLNVRGNEEKFQYHFREMVAEINKTLNAITAPLDMASEYIDKIGKGEIPEKITDEYNGDFNRLKESINSCIEGLDGLREASEVLGLMSKNDYTRNVGGESLGIFADMRKSVNKVLLRLNAVQNVLIQISNGDLGKLDFYKSVGRSCENDKLVPSLVIMMSSIKALVEDINVLTVSAQNGNLSERADETKHNGMFKEVIIGVNKTLDAVVRPLNMAAEYVDKISKGNIPPRITEEYNGDINTLKENLNICIEAVNLLVTDVNMLSNSAVEGKLDVRADESRHGGDFRKIVAGMNTTIDAVVTPIKEGVGVLSKMASGDLTIKIESDYKGDHQLIKNSINTVAESLNKALGDVSNAVSATASASNQISSSTEEMAAGSREQTTQTAEVASSVEEMTRTILENTKNASLAAEAAKEAGLKAKTGGNVVSETIDEMNRIAEVVQKSSEMVRTLGKSSDEIGEIVQVINDIADQTNLLALNAAIEAARAGEQGRGFAVVADEVRNLADRTSRATKEIATMIQQIQKDTHHAVESMQEGTKQVETGKTLANKAGASLDEIVVGAQKVVDIVTQVAAASEQQSAAAEQISKNVEAISSVTEQTASGNVQVARAAEDLNRLTVNLENLVNKFSLNKEEAYGLNSVKLLNQN